MKLAVNGIGIVSTLGTVDSIAELLQQSQISVASLASSAKVSLNFPSEMNIPGGLVRRMSHFAKMAVLSAGYALVDSELDCRAKRVGIIEGSVYGPITSGLKAFDELIDFGDDKISPTTFSGSVFNAAATYLSLAFGIQGPILTQTAGADTLYNSLTMASLWLESGMVDYVILGVGDEFADYFSDITATNGSNSKSLPTSEGWTTLIVSRADAEKTAYGQLEFDYSEQFVAQTENQINSFWNEDFGGEWNSLRGAYPAGVAFDVALLLLARKLQRFPRQSADGSEYSVSDLNGEALSCCNHAESGKAFFYYRCSAR